MRLTPCTTVRLRSIAGINILVPWFMSPLRISTLRGLTEICGTMRCLVCHSVQIASVLICSFVGSFWGASSTMLCISGLNWGIMGIGVPLGAHMFPRGGCRKSKNMKSLKTLKTLRSYLGTGGVRRETMEILPGHPNMSIEKCPREDSNLLLAYGIPHGRRATGCTTGAAEYTSSPLRLSRKTKWAWGMCKAPPSGAQLVRTGPYPGPPALL